MLLNRRNVAWLLLVTWSLSNSAAVAQRDGGNSSAREARGVVKAIDAKAGTITLSSVDGRNSGETTVKVTDKTEVVFGDSNGRRGGGREGKLADIAVGSLVFASLPAEDQPAESLSALGPQVRGLLKSVDAAKKQVTVTVQSPGGRGQEGPREASQDDKTYDVLPTAEVGIDDGRGSRFSLHAAKLADIAAGSMVSLQLSADQKGIEYLIAEGRSLSGTVKSIDDKRITIAAGFTPGRSPGEEVSYDLGDGVVVLLDDGRGRRLSLKSGKAADVPTGAAVRLRLSPDQKSVAQLTAEGPSVPARVLKVDAEKRQVTFSTGGGRETPAEEKTLPIAEGARVMVDNKPAELKDIPAGGDNGAFAQLRLSLDQQSVQMIVVIANR